LVVIRDITERKRMEASLRLTQFAVEHASDTLLWMTPTGRIVDVNEAGCRSLGYTRAELFQLDVTDLDTRVNADRWSELYAELRRRGSLTFESEVRAKDGRLFPVEIVANFVQFGDQEHNFAFVRDITNRRRADAALREKLNELERMNRLMVGRELRMIELKREVNELCRQLNLPKRYSPPDDIASESNPANP
jgi:PAS domain S-box-containing protein